MEINGTWYARDTIKQIENIKRNHMGGYYYDFWISFAGKSYKERLIFDTEEQAEQSRKELIKQLEK
jgi:hypothetical protein